MTPHPQRAPRAGARRTVIASLSGVAILASVIGTAQADQPKPVYPSADQVAGAKAAASSAAAQVATLDSQLSASRALVDELSQTAANAMEAANGARLDLEAATTAATAAATTAAKAQGASDDATLNLSRLAAEVYQSGGGGTSQLDVFFGGGGAQGVLDRAAGVDAVGTERARMVQEAGAAKNVAATTKQQAAEAEGRRASAKVAADQAADQAARDVATAQTQCARLGVQQQQMTAKLASLQKTSVALEQQRQAGLAAEEQRRREEANRRAAAARAAAAAKAAADRAAAEAAAADRAERLARTAREKAAAAAAAEAAREAEQAANSGSSGSGSSGGSTGGSTGGSSPVVSPPPPTSGGVAAVIAYAQAQLGKPYVWGAAGPGSFDCSGLTMMAWRQAGVSLAHYTGYQYAETARVPISQLQPGDLVFYGVSGPSSHHVGLYIGGGMMIHAPNSRTVVKIASIYSMSDLLPYGGRP